MEIASMLKMPPKIGVGVDPEIFLIDKVHQRYTSAHDLVPGTKEAPHPLKNGAVQVDGVALEYNTKPAYTAAEFKQYNEEVLEQLRKLLPEDRYAFSYEPAVFFDKVFFDKLPMGPKELGCTPDFNAYTGKQTPKPTPKGIHENMRTGSGHIHVSWTEDADPNDESHRWDCNFIVKILESTVGQYIKYWDTDEHRANLYGKPGALRYRTYGVEWRTPSNAWLRHKELWPWLFEAVTCVVKNALSGKITSETITGFGAYRTNRTPSSVDNTIQSILPDFPSFPKSLHPKVVKTTKKQAVIRISGTMYTTGHDINLDAGDGDFNELEDEMADIVINTFN